MWAKPGPPRRPKTIATYVFLTVLVLAIHSPLFIQHSFEPALSVPCTANQPRTNGSRQGRVIVMSYMRSGSSFTGHLLQISQDVYYIYEPLLYTGDKDIVPRGTPISSRLSYAMDIPDNPPKALDYLLKYLRCNITVRDMLFLQSRREVWELEKFDECKKPPTDIEGIERCLPGLLSKCEDSHTVVEKVLRLKMWEIDELLACDLDLKVVHVVRDPRGVALSREVKGYFFSAGAFCTRLLMDAVESQEVAKKYPGRLHTVRYEDIARSPLKMAQLLYLATGIPWKTEVETSLKKYFAEKIPSATSVKWRKKIDFKMVEWLQYVCQNAMKIYGYNKFDNEEQLRNFNISSFNLTYTDGFNKIQVNS